MFDKALFGLPGIRRVLALLAAASLGQAASIIGQAWSLAAAVTNLWNAEPLAGQAALVAVFLGCFLLKQAISFAQDKLLSGYAAQRALELRGRLLGRAFTGPIGWVRAHGTASFAACALEGVDQVEAYLKVILPKIANVVIVLPVTLVAVFLLDWVSGVILLLVVPAIVFFMILLGRLAKDRAAGQYGTYQRLSDHFIDTLRGLDTLKALGAGKRQVREIFERSEEFRRATIETLRVATLSSAVLDLLATLGVAAVAMMLGFRLVVGQMPLFPALAVLIISPEYFLPLRQFAGDFHASLDGHTALADILRLLEEGDTAECGGEELPLPSWGEGSELALDHVSFLYEPGAGDGDTPLPALDDVTFTARGFQKIGIIGPSGSGKSTLAHLLGGFLRPGGGSIAIDGAALPDLRQPGWQRQVLYIPQDPYLFHATLRENLAFYTPEASDEQLLRAAEAVGLAPLLAELPCGLDTVIGEGGRGLSGGQAHRIALARALLDPSRKVLVFDEPTAHLDLETELELKERMLPLMEGRLVFFATHRLHWMEDMDRILLVREGKLEEIEGRKGFRDGGEGRPRPDGPRLAEGAAGAPQSPGKHVWSPLSPAPDRNAPVSDTPDPAETGDLGRSPATGREGRRRDTWVRPYFGRYRKTLAKALALGAGTAAFSILLMLTAGYLIAGTAEARGSILYYYLPIAFVQLFGLGKPLLRYLERLESHDWVFRMTSSLRVRLFKALERRAAPPGGRRRTGDVLGLVAEDIGHIQNLYLRTLFPLAVAWLLSAAVALAFAAATPWFGLLMLVLLGVLGLGMPLRAQRAMRGRVQEEKALKGSLYRDLTDDLLGIDDWRFSGRGAQGLGARMAQDAALRDARGAIDRFTRWTGLATALLLGSGACAVLAWSAWRFGGVPGGAANWIAAFTLGFFPLIEVLSPLPAAGIQSAAHRDSIERLNDLPETDDGLDDECAASAATSPGNAVAYRRGGEDIVLEDVAFRHSPGSRPVLDGISLSIPAGQRVAILGRSGSGKSTLAALLHGDLSPLSGRILIGDMPAEGFGDGIARHMGIVQQDAYLFNRSLRENLALARPNATDDELGRALELVGLGPLVEGLPDGMDTMADEAGRRFSGGERHRIALARALLADTPIILLDEPTVGLDPDTEQGILDTLLETTRGRTLVMITHHLQGIERFDRVIFLEGGRIELDGAPAELAATSERYRMLLAFDRRQAAPPE